MPTTAFAPAPEGRDPVELGNTSRRVQLRNLNQPASFYFYRFLPVLDLFAALAVLAAVLTFSNLERIPSVADFLSMRVTLKNVVLLAASSIAWWFIFDGFRRHDAGSGLPLKMDLLHVCLACALGAAPVCLFASTSVSRSFGYDEVARFAVACLITLSLLRVALRFLGNVFGPRFAPVHHVLIVGSGKRAEQLLATIHETSSVQYELLGFVDDIDGHEVSPAVKRNIIGGLDDLGRILQTQVIDEVMIALPVRSCYGRIQSVIHLCESVGVQCKIPSDSFSYSIAKPRVAQGVLNPVITLKVVRDDYTLLIKRLIDIIGSIVGLIVLSPLMAAIAIAIRRNSPGPALFRQKRCGLNKRVFTMYKFRSMYRDAEQQQYELERWNEMTGPVFKIRNDPRITPVGRFLRKTSLDELPQLWNVLNGTMSLVGPRPLPLRDVARFEDAWLMRRFSVKPGLTCLWQITGRNEVDFDQWIQLDLRYIDRWSLGLDLEILAKTVSAVVKGHGAA